MSYRIVLRRAAVKGIAHLHPEARRQVWDCITALAHDPRPPASLQLEGKPKGFRRLRIGDYRAIYIVDEGERCIAVTRVGPRGSVYQ